MRDSFMLKNMVITVMVALLVVGGLAVLVYVGVARDRIMATPTPEPVAAAEPSRTPVPPPPSETPTRRGTVLGRVLEYSPGALIIVIDPIEGEADQVIVPDGIVITQATGERSSAMAIAVGQIVYAEGEVDAIGRLVADRIVITQLLQPTSTTMPPTVTVMPPTPEPERVWAAEYYDNPTLSGEPVLARRDGLIDYNWAGGAPADELPQDGFSVRWTGRWYFEANNYRIYAYVDDGVRVWVDGALLIDQWREQPATLFQADLEIAAGYHDVEVNYFESVDDALVRVWWDNRGAYPEWKGEYFSNTSLSGEPSMVRNDPALSFDWSAGSPASQLPVDGYSARWTRSLSFSEGTYRFYARGDDGIRVWVDSRLIVDEWHTAEARTYDGNAWLVGGMHDLRVEFFEEAGNASVSVWWEKVEEFPDWQGEYFDNPDLAGEPAVVRNDPAIDFDWGRGSPQQGLPGDNFSVRWRRSISFDEGRYHFWIIADDGTRLYVDGVRIIDRWYDSPAERYEGTLTLSSGEHDIVLEYYERGDEASIQMGWVREATATPTASATWTPSLTPTPAATATETTVATPSATTPPATGETGTPEPTDTPEGPTRESQQTPTATEVPRVTRSHKEP